MKNKLLGMGMLAGMLTLALVMFGCDHNPRPWDGEDGGYVDPKIVGDWWYQDEESGTLSIMGGGEIEDGNGDTFAFTASGGIIKVNMGQKTVKGEYGFSGEDSGTLSIIGIPDAPQQLYRIPPKAK
jgi:hypothetical protein